MDERFNEAAKFLEKSGIVDLVMRRQQETGQFTMRGPLPISRGLEQTGAALLLRVRGSAGADPYEYYEGEQVGIFCEPGKRPQISVRSAELPVAIKEPRSGKWSRAKIDVVKTAVNALKNSPAKYSWMEGMSGETTNLR